MQSVISNQLKAVLFPGNIDGNESQVKKESGATIQSYSYCSVRTRDHLGRPYSKPHSTVIDFTLRNFSKEWVKFFLKQMTGGHPEELSFVFNAVFDPQRYLDSYDSAFIVRGYVVDVNEIFDNSINGRENLGQSLLSVKMTINSITYPGSGGNKVLIISND